MLASKTLIRTTERSLADQRGFFLVGLSIALLAAAIATMGLAKSTLAEFSVSNGQSIGNQLQTVNTGLLAYVNANSAVLSTSSPVVNGVASPLSPTIEELKTLGFLNSAVKSTPTLGTAYNIKVTVMPNGCTSDCQVTGAVWLSDPIFTANNSSTDIRLLGAAMGASATGQIGISGVGYGGQVNGTPYSVEGPGWKFANPDARSRPGILYATTAGNTSSMAVLYWRQSVSTQLLLPTAGNNVGDGRLTRDTAKPYMWTGSEWRELYSSERTLETVAIGPEAGNRNLGSANVFAGSGAAASNTTGSRNVFVGRYAGRENTTGESNVFIGNGAGWSNTTGGDNIFIGKNVGSANITGYGNIFLGSKGGSLNRANTYNIFIGGGTGDQNTTGTNNIFMGYGAGYNNTTGENNVLKGQWAGQNNTTGRDNIFTGYQAGKSNTTGQGNIFTGYQAGYSNTTGQGNIFTGYQAGYSSTACSYSTLIGHSASSSVGGSSCTNATALGYGATAPSSNSVRIGNTAVTVIGGQVAWSNLSDRRLKTNIEHSTRGLDFVRQLQPVDYLLIDNQKAETGFIAQDVEAIDPTFPGVVRPAHEKDFYSLTYTDFIPAIVKSIQQLDQRTYALTGSNLPGSSDTNLKTETLASEQILIRVLCALMAVLGGIVGKLLFDVKWLVSAQKQLAQRTTRQQSTSGLAT